MRRTAISIALEAIDFQEGKLFRELTEVFQSLRGFGKGMSDVDYWASKEVQQIAAVVFKHTKIRLQLNNGDESGPMVITPRLDANHPFVDDKVKQLINEGFRYDGAFDVRRLMQLMDTDLARGWVDLKTSRVEGIYQQFVCDLWLPRAILESDEIINAEGAAAVTLHEVGHVFGYFEYVGRAFSTNQVLAGMVRAMDKTVDFGQRHAVFAKGMQLLRMNKDQQDALLNAKSEAEVSVIVLDAAVTRSRSELKLNIFDATGCEQVADQFAARHGAARAFVLASHQMQRFYQQPEHFTVRAVAAVLMLFKDLFSIVLDIIGAFLRFLSIYIFFADYEVPEHNTLKGRYTRVLHECTERLKNRELTPEQKREALADYAAVKAVTDEVQADELPLARKFSYYLNPRYRNARKFHLLQNDLEALAATGLFANAAKLSSL